ncbi:hypothetical protein [Streptomyces sp. NPDC046942]|uniref:hypothetical protein n=1 Tax=Streptomyces sp. NPDC046942 TaxID=3155137 RepID=UPI0033DBA0C4
MARYTPNIPGAGSAVEQAWLAGRAEGHAQDILRVLCMRGIEVSDTVRARLDDCVDVNQLRLWFERCLTVARAEDLFFGDWGDQAM